MVKVELDGVVAVVCDGDACGALGGRSHCEEEALALAWENGFHSHVTRDDEEMLCPRCAPGCRGCAALNAEPEPAGHELPWELTAGSDVVRRVPCAFCGVEVVEADARVWAFNLLCDGCFALRFTGRAA